VRKNALNWTLAAVTLPTRQLGIAIGEVSLQKVEARSVMGFEA
jgi:hypothetical protein